MCGRRLLDVYDSARVSQYEFNLQTRLGQNRELTVPPPRLVQLTTAHCYIGDDRRPPRTSPRAAAAATQQQQRDDDNDVDQNDDDDDSNDDN